MRRYTKCKLAFLAVLAFNLSYIVPARVEAATGSARVILSATIAPVSRLTVDTTTVDPDSKASRNRRISAGRFGAVATARVSSGSIPATLTVSASEDLLTGSNIDPVAAVTARVTDARGNTLPAAEAWGCLSYSETFNWYLIKSWNCDTGKQAVTVIYTLISP